MSETIKKILVPVDGSKASFKSLDRALILAGFTNAEVTVLHVIPHVERGGPRTTRIDKEIVLHGKEILRKAANRSKKKGRKFKTKLVRGTPSLETVKAAKNGKFDHIVMSTTGAGSAEGEMLGSVSNFVVHKSKIPVYLIK
jgi:nucleotide-binding universal stress UspA family protein